jgi:hypothetical protein
MIDTTIIQAIQAGGNVGLLLMGLSLMRLHVRVAKIELRQEMRLERQGDSQ